MIHFDGYVALVTGGASGIGRATALTFARLGARVVIADRAEEGGRETVAMICDAGGEADYISVDVSNARDVTVMAAFAAKRYGLIQVAVNAAGVPGKQAATADLEEGEIDRVHAINVRGTWLCMRAEIRHMLQRGGGAIVNIASAGSLIASPTLAGYGASKHAVLGLTKTAAVEYAAKGIRINAVCPGPIRTPMLSLAMENADFAAGPVGSPMGRIGEAQEVADASVYLCSSSASYITGVGLPVDGGFTAQ